MKIYLNGKIIACVGDITLEDVDAIVNAANSSLLGGGGVDGAIHRVGGIKILEECKKIRQTVYPDGLPTGQAVVTTGGNLKAKYVIHTVGPIWYGGKKNEDQLLANAYLNSIKEAENLGVKKIAFPAISTGVYGFPKDRAARIVSNVLREYFKGEHKVELIKLVFFNEEDYDIFIKNAEF
ncbi:MAG: O-acetyl-ADP-ribose deacetylase [Brevinematales bacterium]|nr:O-acetyl-ADP-ribose deacetylase [Brevinematales bacterium]